MPKFSGFDIAILVPDLCTGGGERVTAEIARELMSGGRSVFLVTDPSSIPADLNALPYSDVRWHPARSRFKLVPVLARLPKECIVLAVLTAPSILAAFVNIFLRRRLVVHEHSDVPSLYFANGTRLKRFFRYLAFHFVMLSAHRILVPSHGAADRLRSAVMFGSNKIAVAPNPVQDFLTKIRNEGVSIVEPHRVSLNAFLVGRWSPEKRLVDGVRACIQAQTFEQVVVVTNAAHEDAAHLTAMGARVYPKYSALGEFCPSTAVLINFSIIESFSLVIGEWLAAGLLVFSVHSDILEREWSAYRGFYFIENDGRNLKDIASQAFDQCSKDVRPQFSARSVTETVKAILGDDLG